MTRLQRNKSQRNRNAAWKKICGDPKGMPGYVLHHKDTTMIKNNVNRYIEWNVDDLVIMSKAEHLRLHRKGTHHSKSTKLKMRKAKLGVPKSTEHRRHMSESHLRYWFNRRHTVTAADNMDNTAA